MFLVKYSSSGAYQWSKCAGATAQDIGADVATDTNGSIVVTGKFQGAVDFGGGQLTSTSPMSPDAFVIKYSPSGGHIWSMALGANYGVTNRVAVDRSGNIALTGYFIGAANFGGGPVSSAGGGMDIFVAKYSPNANHIWSARFGDTGSDIGRSIAVDVSGNIVVAGSFRLTVGFGYGSMSTNGYDQAFLVRFIP